MPEEAPPFNLVITSAIEGEDINVAERILVEGPRDELMAILNAGMFVLGGVVEDVRTGNDGILHSSNDISL